MSLFSFREEKLMDTLTFTLPDKPGCKWKNGRFEVENLAISFIGKNPPKISYSSVRLYLDDELYDDRILTWSGKATAASLFESTLCAFLSDNKEAYASYGREWTLTFGPILNLKKWKNGLLMTLPQYEWGSIVLYELEFATSRCLFYNHDNEDFLVLSNPGNDVMTDSDIFYEDLFRHDVEDIVNNRLACIYATDNRKAWIRENEKYYIEKPCY